MQSSQVIAHIGYLISISLFIIGIKRLAKVKTARSANALAALAMLIAIISQLIELGSINYSIIIAAVILGGTIGMLLARLVQMTAMPQLVAVFNGFGGGASACVALAVFTGAAAPAALSQTTLQGNQGWATAATVILSIVIGTVTLSGSIIAYLKLSEYFGRFCGKPVLLPGRHLINALLLLGVLAAAGYWAAGATDSTESYTAMLFLVALTLALGILIVIPIGGADMPVVISLLNSYSGLAAAATGFVLQSYVLIVSGALVGASGMILTMIMCRGMNRSLLNVMVGGFGAVADSGAGAAGEYHNVKSVAADEAALDFDSARSIIIVPGYGLAVSQAQKVLTDFCSRLKARGCQVRYAIHPVAGRMPGHMNVLLAEANVPYDELYEMDSINGEFRETDIALVVGANDVVNPAAQEEPSSPLYGMPVLNVAEAGMVFVIKRSLNPGFAGVKNTLFEKDNCRMIYGDAKKVLDDLKRELDEAT